MKLQFDESNLERVAEVVKFFNPHAHGDLVAFMKQVAQQHLVEPGYIATTGFMLTAYMMPPAYAEEGGLFVKASVAAECFHHMDFPSVDR